MLKVLRGKKSSLLIKIVLVVITIGFSFWGIESYLFTRVDSSVATVNGTEISQDQFRQRFDENRQRMMQMMGGAVDASYFERPEMKRQVLDQLINEQLLLDANRKLGISVTNERIKQEILGIPAFQKDGKFDPDTYKALLQAQNMTPLSFDDRVRQSLSVRELPDQVGSTVLITDAALDTYLRLHDQRRDFRYIKLDKPAADDAPVTDDEVQAYFKDHAQEFVTPERVALEYVELDGSKLDVATSADDATLKDRYEKEKTRFVSPEQRLASHILIKVSGKGSPEDQKQALAKAEAIAKDVKSGKDFAAAAKQDSADLGSKNQGGDLGWLEKGTTDEAFEGALFAMKKGDISDPVLTSEGYHIIQLRDVRPGTTRSFEDVKPELSKEFAGTERERIYTEKAGRLTDLTYQDPSSLDSAAKELGLAVQKTDLFARRGGAGIAANPNVLKAAFSDTVLVQNNNSDPIELAPNHIAVVRVAEHKPATPKPLDEVRDQVRAKVLAERAAKKAKTRADELFAALGKGQSLDDIASANKLKIEKQQDIGRDAVNVDSAIVTAAFALPRPQADKPQRQLVPLGSDSYALLQLDSVVDGDPSKLDAKTKDAARNTLAESIGTTATREFVDALRADAKVRVSEDRLDQQQ
ncbi:MAG TPA: SurA N-terminal domain-containing protein [Rhodanobacteraceae bacterium]|jgi:peptidyl-prolyl cis-trans isomerase D|nr:SurA N-terminal domain-containing protein [Rhodanobacteraceae bacterium]